LLEWKYQRVEELEYVTAEPQHELSTERGQFVVDLLVKDRADGKPRVTIEVDGHDFHEKTKAQVAYDKSRERAIVTAAGVPILRFSGSEVVRNARACVLEVVGYLRSGRA
jgi:very-short-patch-repair endonuclease